ncbi:MAG: hypothetical protein GYB31_03140 [Bacteroidetes bacterium]|nr:hypothetical protein [Bacteroidota bacterium]
MKAIIPTVLFMLIGLSLQAGSFMAETSDTDCREAKIYDMFELSNALKVENDLLSGVWTFGASPEKTTVYRFRNHGLLEIVRAESTGEPQYDSYMWRVEEYNNQAFLVLTTNDFQHEYLYQTLPTCQGMVLVDPVSIDQISLTYNVDAPSEQQKQINNRLLGVWENATYPYRLTNSFEECGTFEPIEGAYLKYRFNSDGTFVRSFGSHLVQMEETGYYEIFEEGQYVVFHVQQDDGNFSHHVARIKYLEYGELVLEQTLESDTDDFAAFFCSDLNTVSFIK